MSLCLVSDDGSCPYPIHPSQVVDTLISGSSKNRATLDGDVGWIRTNDCRMGVPDEGVGMMNTIHTGNLLVVPSIPGRTIGGVLLSEQELVGLQESGVHGLREL